MTKSSSKTEPPDKSKAVLFCPVCDHKGELATDWIHESTTTTKTVTCPDCSSIILKNAKKRQLHC